MSGRADRRQPRFPVDLSQDNGLALRELYDERDTIPETDGEYPDHPRDGQMLFDRTIGSHGEWRGYDADTGTWLPAVSGGGGGTLVHELASETGLGADHTVTGLTPGHVLKAISPTDAHFAALVASDLPVVDVPHGGTGSSSIPSGNLLIGALALAMTFLAPGAAGGFVRSDGSSWVRSSILVADIPAHHATHETGGSDALTALSASILTSGTIPSARLTGSAAVLGDLLYSSAADTWARLAGNTTTTRNFLRQTGTGVVSAAPVWDTILAADIPASAVTRSNDTNVTMTLGGSPTVSSLAAWSMTLGWSGQLGLSRGGTNADLSATGGTHQVLQQSTAGAAITVGQLTAADIAAGTFPAGSFSVATLAVTSGLTLTGATITGAPTWSSTQTLNTSGNAATATAWATGRTVSITGDLSYTSGSLDGSANVTGTGTLATVATAGTTGSSTAIPVITINVKGLTTSITTAAVIAPAGTLTGTTLASNVVTSSLTSTGVLASLHMTSPTIDSGGLVITSGNISLPYTADIRSKTSGGTVRQVLGVGDVTGANSYVEIGDSSAGWDGIRFYPGAALEAVITSSGTTFTHGVTMTTLTATTGAFSGATLTLGNVATNVLRVGGSALGGLVSGGYASVGNPVGSFGVNQWFDGNSRQAENTATAGMVMEMVPGNSWFLRSRAAGDAAGSVTTPATITAAGALTLLSTATATQFLGTILDSNAASDLLLKRNGTTKVTVGASAVTFVDVISSSQLNVNSTTDFYGYGALSAVAASGPKITAATAGALYVGATEVLVWKTGILVGNPTGGDKGAGTINVAGDVYKNGTAYTNPDYVFPVAQRGGGYAMHRYGLYEHRTLAEIEEYTIAHARLPDIHSRPMGVFERSDWVLQHLERAFVGLFDHESRLAALEQAFQPTLAPTYRDAIFDALATTSSRSLL